MSTIYISDLIISLNENKDFCNMELFKKYMIKSIINWRDYIIFNNYKYSKNIIYRNTIFEIIMISWLPGQYTKLHEHPKNGCLMKVLYGTLNEILFSTNKTYTETKINTNEITFIKNNKHIISNISNKCSISIHIYSPPNYY